MDPALRQAGVGLQFEERPSDSPYVDKIWRIENDRALPFLSVAKPNPFLVFGWERGTVTVTFHGPETRATPARTPCDAEFLGIFLKVGASIQSIPLPALVDGEMELPQIGKRSFWLGGRAWEVPTFENADTFLAALAREGLLARDDLVTAALHGESLRLSSRSVQRRFVRATGLAPSIVRQILRAQRTARLLGQGVSILDALHGAGYFDQPHMTKAIKHYFGQTPAQMSRFPSAISIF